MDMFFRGRSRKNKRTDNKLHDDRQPLPLSFKLNYNLEVIRSIYEECADMVFRPFLIGGKIEACLIYLKNLTNMEELDANVLAPLMQVTSEKLNTPDKWLKMKLAVTDIQEVKSFDDCVEHISIGNPVLLMERENQGFALGLSKWEKRSIEEPMSEPVVRGPREGFTEILGVNISLLRRKLRSPQLKIKTMRIGRYTQTEVAIAYIEGIVDKNLVEEVITRLQRIDIDGVLESGYIEEWIEDEPFSPFPQLLNTERPDVVVAGLLEGRVTILAGGTPFALIAPITLYSLLQSSEDYYQRFLISTAIRWLRYLFVVISLLLPSIYVALLTFHQEMVPTTLLESMAASREKVPFPALIEALIMEITFEALREAGIRLPKQVGAAVSIVGALVIGQAAVQAGIVSAPMVMVVALTGIASFSVPRYAVGNSLRMLRFPMILLAGTLGLLGVMLGILCLLTHLCSLRSFGVPYLSPMAPMKGQDMKDVLIRAPWWKLNTRPHLTGEDDKYRQAPNQNPDPTLGKKK